MSNSEKIAQAAYYKWEAAGKPHGRHEEFWLEAEKDETLNTQVRELWQTAKERTDNKIQSIWQAVKWVLSTKS